MSNSELFHIDKEELSDLEVSKSPMLMFQNECHAHESLSISSDSHSHDHHQEKVDEELEENHLQSRIVLSKSKQSDSEADTTSTADKQHSKVGLDEEDHDGFRTPTSLDHRISVTKQCPPAPRKPKPSLKRKPHFSPCSCRYPLLDLSKEVELLLHTQQKITLPNSHQAIKKVRRE